MLHPDLMNPKWNIRKAVKELLLLEEHLSDPEQRCADCIWKHLLKTEAWLEEALTLDNQREYTFILVPAQNALHGIQNAVSRENLRWAGADLRAANIAARGLRKSLQPYAV